LEMSWFSRDRGGGSIMRGGGGTSSKVYKQKEEDLRKKAQKEQTLSWKKRDGGVKLRGKAGPF